MDGSASHPDLSQGREEPLPRTPEDLESALHIGELAITSGISHQASDSEDINSSKLTMDIPEQSADMDQGGNHHDQTGNANGQPVVENMLQSEGDHASLQVNAATEAFVPSLRKFPAEIRQMIFSEVITAPDVPRNSLMETIPRSEKQGILGALRCERDQTLYREALEMYYKKNTVELTDENLEKIQGLCEETLSLVRHMCISYRYEISCFTLIWIIREILDN